MSLNVSGREPLSIITVALPSIVNIRAGGQERGFWRKSPTSPDFSSIFLSGRLATERDAEERCVMVETRAKSVRETWLAGATFLTKLDYEVEL